MGNSCVTGSDRPNQGRAMGNSCVTGSVCLSPQKVCLWTIDGFSSLLEKSNGWTYSSAFQIRGVNWYLKLNPRGTKSGRKEEYVSLNLELAQSGVKSSTVVEASFKLLIYDQLYGKDHVQQQVSHNFQATSTWTAWMIPLTKLMDETSGFLINNCCTFGVEFIRVVGVKGNDVSETLFVQRINKICNDPQVYNWNIDDFFVLKNRSTSPEFELCGNKWFIIIYPYGRDKNGNYLSLYLTMKAPNTFHENAANLVEFSISIKGQEIGKHKKMTGRFQFSKNGGCWGWNKFVSLEDFKDPSNGYLVKRKCCIEAQVAVIGSSKTE